MDTGGNGQTQDWFAEIDFQYVKKVPLGEFQSTLFLGYNDRSVEGTQNPVTVVNQPFTFVDFLPIFIPGQTVTPSSIQLSDSTGRIFTEGIDYTLQPFPTGVQVGATLRAVLCCPRMFVPVAPGTRPRDVVMMVVSTATSPV